MFAKGKFPWRYEWAEYAPSLPLRPFSQQVVFKHCTWLISMVHLPGGYLKSNVLVLWKCVQAPLVPKCVIWF